MSTFEEAMVDTIAMKLVMNPQQYDVVVTTNLFGDILSDEGAGLVGGLGLAPGLCAGERHAMAQATHGSAPDIAGKGIANPYAMILSGKLLFEWLARKRTGAESRRSGAADRPGDGSGDRRGEGADTGSRRQGDDPSDGRRGRLGALKLR